MWQTHTPVGTANGTSSYWHLKKGSCNDRGQAGVVISGRDWRNGHVGHAARALILTSCGRNAVAAPGSGALDASECGPVPAIASLEVVDSSAKPGPPFEVVMEGSLVFKFPTGGAWFAHPRDGYAAHAEYMRVAFDG